MSKTIKIGDIVRDPKGAEGYVRAFEDFGPFLNQALVQFLPLRSTDYSHVSPEMLRVIPRFSRDLLEGRPPPAFHLLPPIPPNAEGRRARGGSMSKQRGLKVVPPAGVWLARLQEINNLDIPEADKQQLRLKEYARIMWGPK
jgi:hypothetical protein